MRSLRARLLLGSILWAVGLVGIAHLASILLLHRFPSLHSVPPVAMLAIAMVFMLVGLWQVRRGVSPIERLRERLAAVRGGRDRRLAGSYPTEVQPLVDDLNALLDDRERAVERALGTAGDLAHGLKTPLAVLSQEAEGAAAAGHRELAAMLGQQVERMRRQVEYHLAHARAGASAGAAPGVRCPIAESAEALARTLRRLYADRGLSIEVDVATEHAVRSRREDLDEMLGNLLDNACKWARSRVAIASFQEDDGAVAITVDDDGPGLPPALRESVLQRGVRADEAAPGSGLGLAIVRDLAELYGGSIALEDSPAGGLRARLRLPAA